MIERIARTPSNLENRVIRTISGLSLAVALVGFGHIPAAMVYASKYDFKYDDNSITLVERRQISERYRKGVIDFVISGLGYCYVGLIGASGAVLAERFLKRESYRI